MISINSISINFWLRKLPLNKFRSYHKTVPEKDFGYIANYASKANDNSCMCRFHFLYNMHTDDLIIFHTSLSLKSSMFEKRSKWREPELVMEIYQCICTSKLTYLYLGHVCNHSLVPDINVARKCCPLPYY